MRSYLLFPLVSFALAAFTIPISAQDMEGSWDRPLEMCWKFESLSMTSLRVASDNAELVFLPQTPARIIAISLLTGDPFWTVEAGGSPATPPYFDSPNVVFYTSRRDQSGLGSFRMVSIDSLSGVSTSASGTGSSENVFADGFGSSLAVLERSGLVRMFKGSTVKWELRLPSGEYSGIRTAGALLFVWKSSGEVLLIDGETGAPGLSFKLPARPSGSFAVHTKRIYAGSEDGSVYSIDRDSGETEWSSRTGGTIDGLTAEDDGVMAVSRDNFVYFLSDGNGRRIWKRRLAGRIIGNTKISGDLAAFLSYGTNEVVILRLEDGKPVNSFPVDDAEHFVSPPIAAGGRLLIPFDSGLAAYAPKGSCETKKDGR